MKQINQVGDVFASKMPVIYTVFYVTLLKYNEKTCHCLTMFTRAPGINNYDIN